MTLRKITARLLVVISMLLVCCMQASNGKSEKSVSFKVMKNEKEIGSINIDKKIDKASTIYELNSDISARLLFNFNVIGKEISIYKRGFLVYSSVFRKFNNNIKTDHSISFRDGKYYSLENKSSKILNIPSIEQNLVTLYFEEPIGVDKVYCDNENEMVPITKISDGVYRVSISNSKYNIFHYKNGTCIKVEAVSSMFKVNLILN